MSFKVWRFLFFLALIVSALLPGCANSAKFSLSSPAFANDASIPVLYSCDGQNISPPLEWRDTPAGTASLALVLHDPDAPLAGGFTHWVVFNIPPTATGFSADVPKQAALSDGTLQGNNGAGNAGYTGPCPPAGAAHHYNFTLYALDQMLNINSNVTKDHLEAAMSGHILAQAQLTGLFQRS